MMALDRIDYALSNQPEGVATLPSSDHKSIQSSLDYLSSSAAFASLDSDPYWPKWDSPWWHLSVLHEMGLDCHIPPGLIQQLVSVLQRKMVPSFLRSEIPPGKDPVLDTYCHCSLGNVIQIVSTAGLDMDQTFPWARDWFMRYQLPDGGYNCDEAAYKPMVAASSMVGTIAPLEALLCYTKRTYTEQEVTQLDQGATFLLNRKLMRGCAQAPNAEEQADEADWKLLAFPRFYFYDVLRGLMFVLNWAHCRKQAISAHAIVDVVELLCEKSPCGVLRIERRAFEGVGSRIRLESGAWGAVDQASTFELLEEVSKVGHTSLYLTRQWQEGRVLLSKLMSEGLIR